MEMDNWCPLDDRPLEAPPKKVPEPVSKGNLLQVPDYLRYATLESLMDEFLGMETVEDNQDPSEEQNKHLLETLET